MSLPIAGRCYSLPSRTELAKEFAGYSRPKDLRTRSFSETDLAAATLRFRPSSSLKGRAQQVNPSEKPLKTWQKVLKVLAIIAIVVIAALTIFFGLKDGGAALAGPFFPSTNTNPRQQTQN